MPSFGRDRKAEERASHAWDTMARGEAGTHDDLDPSLLATMTHVQSLAGQPRPDIAFINRLEAQLMQQLTAAAGSAAELLPVMPSPPTGRTTPSLGSLPFRTAAADVRRQRAATLATAALVVLVLLGSLVAVRGSWRLVQRDEQPGTIPAFVTTETSLPPGVIEDALLFQQRIDALPAIPEWAGIDRVTIAPGAEWRVGTTDTTGVGPIVFRVEVGTVTARADGPFLVTPSGATVATHVPADNDVILSAGDHVFVESGITSRWRNHAKSPAIVLDSLITSFGMMEDQPGVSYDAAYSGISLSSPPRAPGEYTVRRVTLAPDAAIPHTVAAGMRVAGVVSGQLEVGLSGKVENLLVNSPEPNRSNSRLLFAGSWIDLNWEIYDAKGVRYIVNELRNAGSEPLVVFLIALAPDDAQAANLPVLVESSEVSPLPAGVAGDAKANSAVELRPGDTAFIPDRVKSKWRNDGKAPGTALPTAPAKGVHRVEG